LQRQWEAWQEVDYQFVAPTLLYYEATNAIYQYYRHDLLSFESVSRAQQAILALPVRLISDPDIHRRALQLAERFSLPATYDAHYLALAERMGAAFWTADRRLYRATQAELAWVNLWPEAETAV
jgi:predicted nucleic acid-binding protein